jgi:drug/metabolite transporter superfamily protein YnfA
METTKMKPKVKKHLTSLIIGILGAVSFMLFHPFGSFDPTSFGFYWSLFTGLFVSFSIGWLSTNAEEKSEE